MVPAGSGELRAVADRPVLPGAGEHRDEHVFRPDAGTLVTLEAGGREMTSERWAEWLGQRRQEGKRLTFLIGGPEGLPGEVTILADQRLSLGPQTMAHQLARIVLLEQLFRASKILAGQKYHL